MGEAKEACQLLVLSAWTEKGLEDATDRLVRFLEAHPELELADVAFSLSRSGDHFEHRRIVVCEDLEDARKALCNREPQRVQSLRAKADERSVAFLFPGLGEDTAGMAAELYTAEPVFRETVDRLCDGLDPALGGELRRLLCEPVAPRESDRNRLFFRRTAETAVVPTVTSQPALFVFECALSHLWASWGVRPRTLLGYSVGEYVAACLAGVLSEAQALTLVARRAELISELPRGAMVAVGLCEEELAPLLAPQAWVSAVNGPSTHVVSGSDEAVSALVERLEERGAVWRRVAVEHAFHCPLMDPAREPLKRLVAELDLRPPRRPYVSNVTGTWITDAEAMSPEYWAEQLARPIRLMEGLQEMGLDSRRILLEVGPGQGLSSLALQCPNRAGAGEERLALASLKRVSRSARRQMLEALGRLWLAGCSIDREAVWPVGPSGGHGIEDHLSVHAREGLAEAGLYAALEVGDERGRRRQERRRARSS